MIVRQASEAEILALAVLWHEGWHDAHASFALPEIIRERTIESFAARLEAALPDTFVMYPANPRGSPEAGDPNGPPPVGFFMLKGDELYQFYLARAARGSGAAMTLMAAAEAELARRGIRQPWLACGVGNDRAARFYEKAGWRNTGQVPYGSVTNGGTVEVTVWRFEKSGQLQRTHRSQSGGSMSECSDLVDEFYRHLVRPLGNLVILFAQAEASLLELLTVLMGGDELAAHRAMNRPDIRDQLLSKISFSGLTGFELAELKEGVEGFWDAKEQRNRLIHDEWFPNILGDGTPMTRGLRKRDANELFGEPSVEGVWALALRFQEYSNLFSATAYHLGRNRDEEQVLRARDGPTLDPLSD